jgi:small subunit ribosomal protein S4
VNGKKVDIPSFHVKKGDIVALREKSKKIQAVSDSLDAIVRRGIPQWLEIDKEKFQGEVVNIPAREDITLPIQEQLIVELYSK